MWKEVKTFSLQCDFCEKKVTIQSEGERLPGLPPDWKRVTIRSQDKFDSYRDACPDCAKKYGDILWW